MPQMPSQELDPSAFIEWVEFARDWNITIEDFKMNVSAFLQFKPSQAELNLCKVCSMSWDIDRCFVDGPPSDGQCQQHGSPGCLCAWKTGVSVTDSGYILDGHHHWAAVKLRLLSGLPIDDSAKVIRYTNNTRG